ncbi:hypothetical protein K438DRAFT_1965641 [Mycena galopus ATCC 62051]|nr:hypothetical protein K438DRAFT_1965641 [Mycena galopus ATCC 62051]
MRETFPKYRTDDRVSGWADLIVIAQAFHWCLDHEAAAVEFARILKPGGVLVVMWIHEGRETAPWLDQFRTPVERDEGDAPYTRSGKWRQLFSTPAYTKSFAPPEKVSIEYVLPDTVDGVMSRGLSSSRVVVLSDADKEVFIEDTEAIMQRG